LRRLPHLVIPLEKEEKEEEKPAKPIQPTKKDRVPQKFYVRVDIDPKDASTWDDKIILTGSDGYRSEKTVKDDQLPGDDYVDLLYEGLYEGETYSLQVLDTPGGSPYFIFQNVPYEVLDGVSPDPPPEDPGENESDTPQPVEADPEVES